MRHHDEVSSPGRPVWGYGAVGVVAVLLVGGGWLVAAGLTGPPPTQDLADDRPVAADRSSPTEGLGRFPPTADGAAGAAAAAVAELGRPEVLFDDTRLGEVAAGLFAEGEVRPQLAEIAVARQGFARSGWDDAPQTRRSYFSTPLAVRLVGWDPDRGGGGAAATVEVWSVTVVTVGDVGGAVWTTSTVELSTDPPGRWWITGLDSIEGPTPAVAGPPTVPGVYRLWLGDLVPTVPTPASPVEVEVTP